jgi:hypothetical protein
MLHYKAYTYDVWGNARDGWEVNDVFYDSTVDIPKVIATSTDAELIKYLKQIGFLTKRFRASMVEITGEASYTLYFEYNGKPEFELRRQE